jgi:hypothetical protein
MSIEGRDRLDETGEAVLGGSMPEELTTLVGFLDDSETRGHRRLFVDPALTNWLDVSQADIVHRDDVPGEQDAHGGRSVLRVKSDAVLLRGAVTTADAEMEFLGGGDAWALRCEPDEQTLVRGSSVDPTVTRLLTPPGRECC